MPCLLAAVEVLSLDCLTERAGRSGHRRSAVWSLTDRLPP